MSFLIRVTEKQAAAIGDALASKISEDCENGKKPNSLMMGLLGPFLKQDPELTSDEENDLTKL